MVVTMSIWPDAGSMNEEAAALHRAFEVGLSMRFPCQTDGGHST